MLSIKCQVDAGTHIKSVIHEALQLSKRIEVGVRFNFNTIEVEVYPWSTAEEVYEDYTETFNKQRRL